MLIDKHRPVRRPVPGVINADALLKRCRTQSVLIAFFRGCVAPFALKSAELRDVQPVVSVFVNSLSTLRQVCPGASFRVANVAIAINVSDIYHYPALS